MPPPFGDKCLGVAAGVQNAENPDIRSADYVENAVRKTVEIHASHVDKTDSIKLWVAHKRTIVGRKIFGKLQPQTGLLVFIPIVGVPQVSRDERMSFEHDHRRI